MKLVCKWFKNITYNITNELQTRNEYKEHEINKTKNWTWMKQWKFSVELKCMIQDVWFMYDWSYIT